MSNLTFTKTQQKIIDTLADGLPHLRAELLEAMGDLFLNSRTVDFHVCQIRKKLRPLGQDILCEYANRKSYYRHVILLPSVSKE